MQKRSIRRLAVLLVASLGLSRLYWLWQTSRELNVRKATVLPAKMIIVPTAMLYSTSIWLLVTAFTPKLATAGSTITAGCFFGAILIYALAWVFWSRSYSRAVAFATDGRISQGAVFRTLLLVPAGLDILRLQQRFNTTGLSLPRLTAAAPVGMMASPTVTDSTPPIADLAIHTQKIQDTTVLPSVMQTPPPSMAVAPTNITVRTPGEAVRQSSVTVHQPGEAVREPDVVVQSVTEPMPPLQAVRPPAPQAISSQPTNTQRIPIQLQ